jgi:hypothetical protein
MAILGSTGIRKTSKAPDKLEQYVRYCLIHNPGVFQNHSGDGLPRMVATIPGQYNSTQGIDIFALDRQRQLWVIEVSRGRKSGALLIKELAERRYAGYKPQMAEEWRDAAATKFLKRPDSTNLLAKLFDVPEKDRDGLENREELEDLFHEKFKTHRKAIVVPPGCHVAPVETKASKEYHSQSGQKPRNEIDVPDIQFGEDIYTLNSPYAY